MTKRENLVAPDAGRSKEDPSTARSSCDQGACGDRQPLCTPRLPGSLSDGPGSAGTALISCC